MSSKRDGSKRALADVIPFDPSRGASHDFGLISKLARELRRQEPGSSENDDRPVVAMVTVTRFVGEERVHAQVPIFADEIHMERPARREMKLTPELSELLADGAVEANAYLDRIAATRAARPSHDFQSRA